MFIYKRWTNKFTYFLLQQLNYKTTTFDSKISNERNKSNLFVTYN